MTTPSRPPLARDNTQSTRNVLGIVPFDTSSDMVAAIQWLSAAPQIPERDRKLLEVFFSGEGGPGGLARLALYVREKKQADPYGQTDQQAGYAIEIEVESRPA